MLNVIGKNILPLNDVSRLHKKSQTFSKRFYKNSQNKFPDGKHLKINNHNPKLFFSRFLTR